MKPATALLTLLLLAGTDGVARAQTAAPKTARATQPGRESARGYCLMKNGEILLVKNGKMAPMTATLTMTDGSLCMPDGTCQRPDGTTVMLKEGQSMLMSGRLSMHPDQAPGPKIQHPKK